MLVTEHLQRKVQPPMQALQLVRTLNGGAYLEQMCIRDRFAGVVLASIPLVTVFLLLQKKFTAGMMAGSVKG